MSGWLKGLGRVLLIAPKGPTTTQHASGHDEVPGQSRPTKNNAGQDKTAYLAQSLDRVAAARNCRQQRQQQRQQQATKRRARTSNVNVFQAGGKREVTFWQPRAPATRHAGCRTNCKCGRTQRENEKKHKKQTRVKTQPPITLTCERIGRPPRRRRRQPRRPARGHPPPPSTTGLRHLLMSARRRECWC
jgi:hypothetical protein